MRRAAELCEAVFPERGKENQHSIFLFFAHVCMNNQQFVGSKAFLVVVAGWTR